MGTYPAKCLKCKKEFMWFSGLPYQLCSECAAEGTLTVSAIEQLKKENPEIVKEIEEGKFRNISMGCQVPVGMCPVCGHTPIGSGDFCRHMWRPNSSSEGLPIFDLDIKVEPGNTDPALMPEDLEEFRGWHKRLLLASTTSGKYGMDHPLGSALLRSLFYDKKVKEALKDAWRRLVVDEEEPL